MSKKGSHTLRWFRIISAGITFTVLAASQAEANSMKDTYLSGKPHNLTAAKTGNQVMLLKKIHAENQSKIDQIIQADQDQMHQQVSHNRQQLISEYKQHLENAAQTAKNKSKYRVKTVLQKNNRYKITIESAGRKIGTINGQLLASTKWFTKSYVHGSPNFYKCATTNGRTVDAYVKCTKVRYISMQNNISIGKA